MVQFISSVFFSSDLFMPLEAPTLWGLGEVGPFLLDQICGVPRSGSAPPSLKVRGLKPTIALSNLLTRDLT